MLRPRRHPTGSSEDLGHAMVRRESGQKVDLRVECVREDELVRLDSGARGVRPAVHRIDRKHKGQTRTRHRQHGIICTYPRLSLGGLLLTDVEALPERARVPPHPALQIEFAFVPRRKIPRTRMKSARSPVKRASRPRR
eukprot:6203821-Pleurochrysis_carterae.AAC.1